MICHIDYVIYYISYVFTLIMIIDISYFIFEFSPAYIRNVMTYCCKSLIENIIKHLPRLIIPTLYRWYESYSQLNDLPMFEHAYDLQSKKENVSNQKQ